MKRLFVVLAFVALAGCGTLGTIISGTTSNPITPKAAIVLHSSFAVAVVLPAGRYASLPRCSKNPPPCSSQAVVNGLRRYINPASVALKKLDAWALGNTSLDGPALYSAAVLAIEAAKGYAASQGVK